MRGRVLALALTVVACNGPYPRAAESPSSASLTPSPAALKGDLPVFQYGLYDAQGNNQRLVGGFLHFPGGAFHRSAGADMVRDYSGDRYVPLIRTAVQPYLFGFSEGDLGQTTYDAVAARWLPVARHQVSDDGLRYAYRELLRGDQAIPGDQPPREVASMSSMSALGTTGSCTPPMALLLWSSQDSVSRQSGSHAAATKLAGAGAHSGEWKPRQAS